MSTCQAGFSPIGFQYPFLFRDCGNDREEGVLEDPVWTESSTLAFRRPFPGGVEAAESANTSLFSKHPILLAKVVNDLPLAVVHPPGNSDQHKPETVDPSLRIQNPLSRPPSRSTEPSYLYADPVFGPYGV
jgi:hypothetical protein